MPVLSVVITAYNAAQSLEESVASILHQTLKDIEIIVVDDGSTDNTYNILRSIPDDRIRLIRLLDNRGRAAAANIGIEAATTDIIARHDADDISIPERLDIQYHTLERCSDVGACGGAIYIGNEVHVHPEVVTDEMYHHNLIHHPTLMFRFRWWVAVGGYSEELERCSDWDFCCKLHAHKCKMINIHIPLVRYALRPAEPAFHRDAVIVRKRWSDYAAAQGQAK